MASRTQIVCLCEGSKGKSIDEVFVNRLIRSLNPAWLRLRDGSNTLRIVSCGNRKAVIERMPLELRHCRAAGGDTTLMVWADVDDDRGDCDALKDDFWNEATRNGIDTDDFNRIVFVFAKDRLENWIEFLETGTTDESREGPRVKHNRSVANAARKLADLCIAGKPVDDMPPSLQWSCRNWRALADRMKRS